MTRVVAVLLLAAAVGWLVAQRSKIRFEEKEWTAEALPAAASPPRIEPERTAVTIRPDAPSKDAYRFRPQAGGTLLIEAGSERAARYARRHASDERTGWIEPAYARRYVDCGAVGMAYEPDRFGGGDYDHTLRAFHGIERDRPARERARAQMRAYVDRMAAYGYNGVVVPGFLDLVELAHADAPARRRALRFVLEPALALEFDVVLRTDMLALTKALEERFPNASADDPGLWRFYASAVDELFTRLPEIDGLMVRVGEAGGCYNDPAAATYSRLGVTRVAHVRRMLCELSRAAARHGKTLYFRTWSIGVGEIGDMHTNPATLRRVLAGLDLDNLVLSTKHVQGDFGSYLPVNPTLRAGDTPRLVEFQARREFEGCGAFPNYAGPLHQASLRALRDAPVTGIWVWNQNGGPQRAGPATLYPFHGEDAWIDMNTYATGRLAWDPDADLGAITRDWIRARWTGDPASIRALEEMLRLSRVAVKKGLYLGDYARRRVLAGGLEPPPMAFVFWNLPGGAHATLTNLFRASRGELDHAVREGEEAVAAARRMGELAAMARFRDARAAARVRTAIAYEKDLLATLAAYREAFLHHYLWLATGEGEAHRAFTAATDRFLARRAGHERRYASDPATPAYNFEEASAATIRMQRNRAMTWLARALLLAGAAWMVFFGRFLRTGAWLLAVATAACFSHFLAPGFVALAAAAAAAALLASRDPRPVAWASLAVLAVCSVRGPLGFWFAFWDSELVRGLTAAVLCGAAAWSAIHVRRPLVFAAAAVLLAWLTPAGAVDSLLGRINEELVVLPFAMARTLGIATHLDFAGDGLAAAFVAVAGFRTLRRGRS